MISSSDLMMVESSVFLDSRASCSWAWLCYFCPLFLEGYKETGRDTVETDG